MNDKLIPGNGEDEANKKHTEKIEFYTELIKDGMDGTEAWNKATEKYGNPLDDVV